MDRKNNQQNQQGPIHSVHAREQQERTNPNDFQQEHAAISNQQHQHPTKHDHKTKAPSTHEHKVTIFIDNKPYYIEKPVITAAEIRALVVPPLAQDCQISHVVPHGNNVMYQSDVIHINPHESKQGRHFVTSGKSKPVSHDDIARKAYEIYIESGCPDGQDQLHWQKAEEQLAVR